MAVMNQGVNTDRETLVIENPRTRLQRPSGQRSKTNFELYAWLFMRLSGLALIFLVLGHLFIMNILDGGVQRINFAFVAGRWSSTTRVPTAQTAAMPVHRARSTTAGPRRPSSVRNHSILPGQAFEPYASNGVRAASSVAPCADNQPSRC